VVEIFDVEYIIRIELYINMLLTVL